MKRAQILLLLVFVALISSCTGTEVQQPPQIDDGNGEMQTEWYFICIELLRGWPSTVTSQECYVQFDSDVDLWQHIQSIDESSIGSQKLNWAEFRDWFEAGGFESEWARLYDEAAEQGYVPVRNPEWTPPEQGRSIFALWAIVSIEPKYGEVGLTIPQMIDDIEHGLN